MTINRTTLLDLPLPVTGTESGVWGDVTNNGLTQYLDIAIAGRNALTSANFTGGALTLATTEGDSSATNIAAGSAQYATLYVSSLAANSTITAPSSNRAYRVVNADATYTLTVKAAGQTGVTFPVSTSGTVVFNGTDYVLLGSYVIASAGTASLPSITFTGDTNTGIFSPAADTIAFAEGGVEAARFDSSGNLCVGSTSSLSSAANRVDLTVNGTTTSMMTLGVAGTATSIFYASSGLTILGTKTASPLSFYTSDTERARIDSSGNVGIGTSSPASVSNYIFVTTNGTTGSGIYAQAAGTTISKFEGDSNGTTITAEGARYIRFATNSAERARITSGGNLLVGQTSGSYKLSVTGTVYFDSVVSTGYDAASNSTLGTFGASNDNSVNNGAVYNIEWLMSGNASGQYWYANYITRTGSRTLGAYCTGTNWTNASDIANKEDIDGIGYGLETVMASRPVDFRWKSMRDVNGLGKKDIGFIAQEMELIVPEVVTGEEGQKGISYGNLVAVAFKAIQEQQALITQLQADVAALKGASA